MRLDDASQKTLDDWIAGGMKPAASSCTAAGDGKSAPGGVTPGGAPTSGSIGPVAGTPSTSISEPLACDADVQIRPKSKFVMPKDAKNSYQCYGFDLNVAQKRHLTAMGPFIDNPKIVHHVILYQANETVDSTPHECAAFPSPAWRMLAVWAPGGKNQVLPEAAGYPVEGTGHFAVQVHYNNINGESGETDGTGYDVCSTDKLRANDADVLAAGSVNFSIPARGSLDLSCSYPWGSGFGDGADGAYPNIHVFSVMPHMHKLGVALDASVVSATPGAVEKQVASVPAWDFNSQPWSDVNLDLAPGDTIKTHCAFQNPGDAPVRFGENTEDEMCFAFMAYYPKVTNHVWSWILPSASRSTTCVSK
jgi:hypothetical protein